MKSNRHMNKDNRIIFGILLVLFGTVLVLKNLGILPYGMREFIFSWPALLFALGVLFFVTKNDKTSGTVLMTIGGIFMLPLIFDWSYNWHRFFWPVVLILIGIVIIRKRNTCPITRSRIETDSSLDYIDEFNVFGGSEKIINSTNFKGGKITCVFGGVELDLSNAQLAEGNNVIDLFAMFGGCTLVVPSDWDVKVEISAVLGGVSDKRIQTKNYIVEPKKELVIKGLVTLGGCEIKSYK